MLNFKNINIIPAPFETTVLVYYSEVNQIASGCFTSVHVGDSSYTLFQCDHDAFDPCEYQLEPTHWCELEFTLKD